MVESAKGQKAPVQEGSEPRKRNISNIGTSKRKKFSSKCVADESRIQDRALMRSLAEAGVSRWVEYVPADSLEAMYASVQGGPLRIE